jgi:hypothetical protein
MRKRLFLQPITALMALVLLLASPIVAAQTAGSGKASSDPASSDPASSSTAARGASPAEGTTTATSTAATSAASSETTTASQAGPDSRDTREELRELLQRLPPEVGKVLKLDPALWKNEAYLSNYPALAAFLAAHPEVAHNPRFFLESVWVPGDPEPESSGVRMWRETMQGVMIFCVLVGITSVLTWLVKTMIEQRRWSRLSKVQVETHNKLFDRFTSSEDLLAYIQSPAGRRFLESAPIPLEAGNRPVSAPVGRILWSVQAGIVLGMVGLGLFFISGRIQKDVSEPMFALGVLVLSVGAGFVVSAVVSYILSRKLGLFAEGADRTLPEPSSLAD